MATRKSGTVVSTKGKKVKVTFEQGAGIWLFAKCAGCNSTLFQVRRGDWTNVRKLYGGRRPKLATCYKCG